MITADNLLIGADPELFIQNTATKAFISAHNLISGTKEAPLRIKRGAVQVDGTAAEFNIDPASNSDEFLASIQSVMATLSDMITIQSKDYVLVATPTAKFNPMYFEKMVPEYAKALGCDPDFNAWKHGRMNKAPAPTGSMRTGGGHIHVGWTKDQDVFSALHKDTCINLTKQLDVCLFLPSLLWDADKERRQMYGKMGCFRPKPYGVEYRSLSNAWLNDPNIAEWVYGATVEATKLMAEGTDLFNMKKYKKRLRRAEYLTPEQLTDHVKSLESWGLPALPEGYAC